MPGLPPPAIELAEQQLGLLSRRQLLRWVPRSSIDDRLRCGGLISVAPGVYRIAGGAVLPAQHAIAAALRVKPPVVITGPWALAWYGAAEFESGTPFRLLTSTRQRLMGLDGTLSCVPDLLRWIEPARPLGEALIAGPVDALIDAASFGPCIGERAVALAFDQLRWRRLLSIREVRERLQLRGNDDADVAAFRQVFAGTGGLEPESEGERRLAPVLLRLRPAPEPQVWVSPHRRVDWYLRRLRCGWEYLGAVDHERADRRRADAARDEELRSLGLQLFFVTARDLDDPTVLLANIMSGLVIRAEQLGLAPPELRA